MPERALLMFEPSESSDDGKLAALLDFFGVPESRVAVAEFLAVNAADKPAKSRVITSPKAFLRLVEALEQRADGTQLWQQVHSVFVHSAGDGASLEELARQLSVNCQVGTGEVNRATTWVVSDRLPDFCKSMSGVRVAAGANAAEATLHIDEAETGTIKIISCEAGAALVKLEYREVPVFISTASRIIDIHSELALPNFDIRREFLSAAPVVMYVKWAFAGTCWESPRTNACLIIDDPPLKPRYGSLDFQHLLFLMQRHTFSTNIAFIPWNWRRSSAKVARLFNENPESFSLSIHGCDHTRGEFGTGNSSQLARSSRQAAARMRRHESSTGIHYDPVMVFPQGVFSDTAMWVLKRSDFIGVVNSEVISTGPEPHPVTVGDAWDVALMTYSSFPIFSRRYPSDGIENFAFDILLGKPCLIVIHSKDCHDRCRPLMKFIDRLNALNLRLSWCSLGETVRRAFRQRELSPGVVEVAMYGSEVLLENPSGQRKRFHMYKQEKEASVIKEIRAGARLIGWTVAEDHIAFEVELGPGESEIVGITFVELPESSFQEVSLRYKAKVMARRYLSELRDNYFVRGPFSL